MSLKSKDICERCKIEPSEIYCPSCQPFHNFCKKCDLAIHSLSIKTSHTREQTMEINPNYSTIASNNHRNHRSFTPQIQRTYQFIEPESEAPLTIRPLINPSNDMGYTKEYVLELKSIHAKEKNELQFKLNALQNNLDRLKMSFQAGMKQVHDQNDIDNEKNKIREERLIGKYNIELQEKDNFIQKLEAENEELSRINSLLSKKIEDNQNLTKQNSNAYNEQIKHLRDEIIQLRKQQNEASIDYQADINDLVETNRNKVKEMEEKHRKEINDFIYDHKYKTAMLKEEIDKNIVEVEKLRIDNSNLNMYITKLEDTNKMLLQKLEEIKDICDNLSFQLENESREGEKIRKVNENLKNQNNVMKNDFEYLERTIEGLKKEILLLKETNYKKDIDFQKLYQQSEKIRKDFSSKMFDVS